MNTVSVRQPRSVLSLLSLIVAVVAATIAGAAIATDDVSGRPSQIVVTPLDENHPAAAPQHARPAPVEAPLDQSHPAAAPENARPTPVADDGLPFTPFSPQSAETAPTDECLDRPVPMRLRVPC